MGLIQISARLSLQSWRDICAEAGMPASDEGDVMVSADRNVGDAGGGLHWVTMEVPSPLFPSTMLCMVSSRMEGDE